MTTASQRETTQASASMATAKEICKPRDDIPSRASSLVLYAASDVKRTRRTPFRLAEPDGVRLGLAFRAIAPLKLRTRIEDILYGIHEISREEARYWHAKARRNNGTTDENELRVLRVLLAGDT